MNEQNIIREINQRHYFLKLAKMYSRQHDIVRLTREIGQLEWQATQMMCV